MNNITPQPSKVYLLLGSNLGDRLKILRMARIFISIDLGLITSISDLYETAPWGELDQSSFLNQALCISTLLPPLELISKIIQIEERLGKNKLTRWGPRTIDIDILMYGDKIHKSANLEIPHPRMLSRNFVLIPLSEIAGEVIHPVSEKSIKELVDMCKDKGSVVVYKGGSI